MARENALALAFVAAARVRRPTHENIIFISSKNNWNRSRPNRERKNQFNSNQSNASNDASLHTANINQSFRSFFSLSPSLPLYLSASNKDAFQDATTAHSTYCSFCTRNEFGFVARKISRWETLGEFYDQIWVVESNVIAFSARNSISTRFLFVSSQCSGMRCCLHRDTSCFGCAGKLYMHFFSLTANEAAATATHTTAHHSSLVRSAVAVAVAWSSGMCVYVSARFLTFVQLSVSHRVRVCCVVVYQQSTASLDFDGDYVEFRAKKGILAAAACIHDTNTEKSKAKIKKKIIKAIIYFFMKFYTFNKFLCEILCNVNWCSRSRD